MRNKIFLDTNIILYYLAGDEKIKQLLDTYDLVTSFITELELLSAPNLSISDKESINILLENVIKVVSYNQSFKETAVDVRSKKKLKLPDAIIAASAISLKLPFISADRSFKNIEGLEILFYDPSAA